MSCTGCEVLVESAVESFSAVTFADANAEHGTLEVGYEASLPDAMGEAIDDYGFELGDPIEVV